MGFSEAIRTLGREFTTNIEIDGKKVNGEYIKSFEPYFNGSLFTANMKCFSVEIKKDANLLWDYIKGSVVNAQLGCRPDSESEYSYKDFGTYTVYDCEYSAENKTYKLICYDNMLKAMVMSSIGNSSGHTIDSLINTVVNFIGCKVDKSNIVNLSQPVAVTDLSVYTYRQILEFIAQCTATTIYFVGDTLKFGVPVDKGNTAEADYMQSETVNGEYKVSRVAVNVYEEQLNADGEAESVQVEYAQGDATYYTLTFSDNPLMTKDMLNAIYSEISKLIFYQFEYTNNTNMEIDFLELFDIEDVEQYIENGETKESIVTKKGLMLTQDISIKEGVSITASANAPTEDEGNYSAGLDTASVAQILATKAYNNALLIRSAEKLLKQAIDTATNTLNSVYDGHAQFIQMLDEKVNGSLIGTGTPNTLVVSQYPRTGEPNWTAGLVVKINYKGIGVSTNGVNGTFSDFAVYYDEKEKMYKVNANDITSGVLKGIECRIAEGTIGGWTIGSWIGTDGKTHNGLKKTFSYTENSKTAYRTFVIDSGSSGSSTADYIIRLFPSDANGNVSSGEYPFAIDKDGVVESTKISTKVANIESWEYQSITNSHCSWKIGSCHIEAGTVSINTNGGTNKTTVKFKESYINAPFVMITPYSGAPETRRATVNPLGTTGFEAYAYAPTDTLGCRWIAIGY